MCWLGSIWNTQTKIKLCHFSWYLMDCLIIQGWNFLFWWLVVKATFYNAWTTSTCTLSKHRLNWTCSTFLLDRFVTELVIPIYNKYNYVFTPVLLARIWVLSHMPNTHTSHELHLALVFFFFNSYNDFCKITLPSVLLRKLAREMKSLIQPWPVVS